MIDEKKLAKAAMSDEELDNVSGGNVGQTVADSQLLYEHGLVNEYHGKTHTFFNWKSASAEVDAGWAKAGITCVTKFGFFRESNKYFKDGKEITRDEAYAHVKANFQKTRTADV